MDAIKQLSDDVIDKIAAGEVVERPASILKELLENSYDARANSVIVELEAGGIERIRVCDDGCGMTRKDALLAVKRHTTSKLISADDLFQISTMGFRGEALASVAAVSRFSLGTSRDGETGVKIDNFGGDAWEALSWSGDKGTVVTVSELFANVPVRKKFLKSPRTEFAYCLETVQSFALAHPEMGIRLSHNGREVLATTPNAHVENTPIGEAMLRQAAHILPGGDPQAGDSAHGDPQNLLYLCDESRFCRIEALVSPPGHERATGKFLFTFVNRRYVKDRGLRYGILRGYHSHILKGKFPVAVLHLTIDPSLVDVNVHPAKTEIRLQYAQEVQSAVAQSIRKGLRGGAWVGGPSAPSQESPRRSGGSTMEQTRITRQAFGKVSEGSSWGLPSEYAASGRPSSSSDIKSAQAAEGGPSVSSAADLAEHLATVASFEASENGQASEVSWSTLDYMGAFADGYLFFSDRAREQRSGARLLVVDQHAFHERILFERLTSDSRLLHQKQPLLVPESITLAPSDLARLNELSPALRERGFDFEVIGDAAVEFRAVPSILAGRDLQHLVRELLQEEDFEEHGDSNAATSRLILATIACHAAVRAGEPLGQRELQQLLAEAQTVDFFHNCPHGRRVFRWWTQGQVERWFDR